QPRPGKVRKHRRGRGRPGRDGTDRRPRNAPPVLQRQLLDGGTSGRGGQGEPFGSHLERAVYEPLGMHHSTSVTRSQDLNDVDGLADGHINVYGIPVPREEPASLIAGSGNVVTTAEDMAHWLAPYTDEGRTIEGEPYADADTDE